MKTETNKIIVDLTKERSRVLRLKLKDLKYLLSVQKLLCVKYFACKQKVHWERLISIEFERHNEKKKKQ